MLSSALLLKRIVPGKSDEQYKTSAGRHVISRTSGDTAVGARGGQSSLLFDRANSDVDGVTSLGLVNHSAGPRLTQAAPFARCLPLVVLFYSFGLYITLDHTNAAYSKTHRISREELMDRETQLTRLKERLAGNKNRLEPQHTGTRPHCKTVHELHFYRRNSLEYWCRRCM